MNHRTSWLVYIVLSILAIIFIHQLAYVVHATAVLHHWVSSGLAHLIPGTGIVRLLRASLALILIPLIIAAIPTFIYWLITRRWWHFYMILVWFIWFILVTVLAYQ